MTVEEFNAHVEGLLFNLKNLLVRKRGEYASDDDVLRNFKRAASLRPGLLPEKVLEGYALKHAVSLCDIIEGIAEFVDRTERGEKIPRDLFYEKLKDYMAYLVLLAAIMEEEGRLVEKGD